MGLSKMLIVEDVQVSVLASFFGVKKLYGFEVPDFNSLSKRVLYETMHRIVKKGYLNYKDGALVANHWISDIFKVIKDSDKVLIINAKDNTRPTLCCYYSEGVVVVMQVSWADKKAFRFTLMEMGDIFNFLDENEYVPQIMLREGFISDINFDILTGEDSNLILDNLCDKKILEMDNLCDVFTIINPKDGSLIKRVCTLRSGIKYMLLVHEDDVRVEMYDTEKFREVLKI